LGYAAGFAAGKHAGITVERDLALGQRAFRAFIPDEADGATAEQLRETGFAVTELDDRGRQGLYSGSVDIFNRVESHKEAPRVIDLIEDRAPHSFVTAEEIRITDRGMLRPADRRPACLVRR
jgi:uncharacterized protein YebE (UPF0316 family)